MAVVHIGLGEVGSDPPFLFCAEFSGLAPPWSIPALYTPTACLCSIRSEAHTAGVYQAKNETTSSTHARQSANQRHKRTICSAICNHNWSYPQEKSGNVRLAKILHFWPRFKILTIYRKIANFNFQRLRKRIVIRSLQPRYPQTINNSLYYYIVFMQDCALLLHC